MMNDKTEPNRNPESTTELQEPTPSFAAEVWNTLSRVDVSKHIQTAEVKKDGRLMYTYQYLGWAWCWSILMKHYPDSSYTVLPEDRLDDGSVMVNLEILICGEGGSFFKKQFVPPARYMIRRAFLPVMDGRNNSVLNPTTRQISDTRQRCLVKGLAMFGLGLDLWAGSDYPVGVDEDPLTEDQVELIQGLFDQLPEQSQGAFLKWLGVETVGDMERNRYKEARGYLERKIRELSAKK